MKAVKVLSAFTGAGGLDLGLEAAGFSVISGIESDKVARETVKLNRSAFRFLEPHDINALAKRVNPAVLGLRPGDLGILAGGPPCQPFSKAAQWADSGMRGFGDPRSDCLKSFLHLVGSFLPEVVFIENVPGFVRGQNSAVSLIKARLEEINAAASTSYSLDARELDAADYGVPQRRKRAILVALRSGQQFIWPKATHVDGPVRAYDALVDVRPSKVPAPKGKWANLLASIPEGENYIWHTSRGGGRPLFGYRTRYWSFLLKLAKAEPSWTLSASPGPSTGPFHWDNRPLAVEELLRLQSFPLAWQVSGKYRDQVRQIGNATPPLLAEVMGRAIGKQVFGLSYESPLTLLIARQPRVPPAKRARPIPSKYMPMEGAHSPHPGEGKGPSPRKKMRTERSSS
jgi:DNA (cytosine-5)-methyltransferase 1